MSERLRAAVALSLLSGGAALAAPSPPSGAGGAASASTATAGAAAASASSRASAPAAPASARGAMDEEREDEDDEGPAIPPPPEYPEPSRRPDAEPRAGTQWPPPVAPAGPPGRAERVMLGAEGGVVARVAAGSSASYAPAPVVGGFVRFDPWPWLGTRLGADWASHGVDLGAAPTGLGAGTTVTSDPIEALRLRARLEPTWRAGTRLRLWGGAGASWTRLVAPEPRTRGELAVRSTERTGVSTDLELAIGGGYEIWPDWVVIELSLGGALPLAQSGTAFSGPLQGIDQHGRLQHLRPLPRFEGVFEPRLGLGLLL